MYDLGSSFIIVWVIFFAIKIGIDKKILQTIFSFAFFNIGLSIFFLNFAYPFYGIIHLILYLGTSIVFVFYSSMVLPLYETWENTKNKIPFLKIGLLLLSLVFIAFMVQQNVVSNIDDFKPIVALSTIFELMFQEYFLTYFMISIMIIMGIFAMLSWNKEV